MSADNRGEIHEREDGKFELRSFNCSAEDDPGYKPWIQVFDSLADIDKWMSENGYFFEYGISYFVKHTCPKCGHRW